LFKWALLFVAMLGSEAQRATEFSPCGSEFRYRELDEKSEPR
jgi:hypothetical protein